MLVSLVCAWVCFSWQAFVDGFLHAIGIIPPFMDIDVNLMNQVVDRVKEEVLKVVP